jgi:hypothetical protein
VPVGVGSLTVGGWFTRRNDNRSRTATLALSSNKIAGSPQADRREVSAHEQTVCGPSVSFIAIRWCRGAVPVRLGGGSGCLGDEPADLVLDDVGVGSGEG